MLEQVCIVAAASQDFADVVERKLQVAEGDDPAGHVEVPLVVGAVVGRRIDGRRHEQPLVVVVPERADRDAAGQREFADAEHGSLPPLHPAYGLQRLEGQEASAKIVHFSRMSDMRPERHLSILAIILLNAAVFAWEQSRETDFAFDYGATPASISDAARALVDGNLNSEVAQKLSTLLTAMFLHGDVAHILYNMVFLWAFGYLTSEHLGQWWALAAFVFCGVCGNIAQVCLHLESPFPIIGASGAGCGFEGIYLG